jgi:glycosyltransferase involved in cell wall biosynthesis
VGLGLDLDVSGNAQRFRSRFGIAQPFVLYVGRRDATKNVPLLIAAFRHYKSIRSTPLQLVLIGSGDAGLAGDRSGDLADLGFVPPRDKADAMAAATILCQPSTNESFSLVIMESWLLGTPVLVHADCAVTVDHCRRSNGGLYFRDAAEFTACLDFLLNAPETARRMGQLGRQYAQANFGWDSVIRRFEHVVQL